MNATASPARLRNFLRACSTMYCRRAQPRSPRRRHRSACMARCPPIWRLRSLCAAPTAVYRSLLLPIGRYRRRLQSLLLRSAQRPESLPGNALDLAAEAAQLFLVVLVAAFVVVLAIHPRLAIGGPGTR